MENEEVMDVSEEEDVDALAEGGFADIVSGINQRLGSMEANAWVTGALAASDAAGGVFTWRNTTGREVEVVRSLVRVKTVATAACTVNVGMSATVASVDNLIDGIDVNAATGLFDNINDAGTNGKSKAIVANGSYVTGSVATGASAGLVGRYALQIVQMG